MFGEGFSVGVDLLLASNAERVLGVLGSELTGVEGKAGRLKSELGTLKSAFVGAFALGAAKELLGVMDEMIKKGADLEQQLYKIATAGYTKSDIDAFRKNASKVAGQFRNVNEKELLKLTLETSAVYGDPQTAMKFLPISAAYIAAEKYRHPENPEGAAAIAEDAIFKVLRSEEFRGLAQDPREVKRGLAASLKGQEVFGDQFDPAIGFQFMKYLRLSGRYVSDRFLNGPGLIVAQEMGGSNAGNSHNMVMQALVGGHAAKSAIEEMMKVGMIDRNKVDKVGGKNWHYDISRAVPDVKLLQSDFDLWAQKHIRDPVDTFTKGDLSKRDQELRKIFGRATQQQYAELMAWQTGPGGRFAKDIGLLDKALTPEAAVSAAGDNLATAGQNLATQIDRVSTAVGDVGARLAGRVAQFALPAATRAADKVNTDPLTSQVAFGALAASIVGGLGFGAYKFIPIGSRLWRALNPPTRSLPDHEGGPGEPGGEGPAGPRGGGSPRPPRAPRSPKPLPPKLRLSAADDVEEVRATAQLRKPISEAEAMTPEERAAARLRPAPSRPRTPLPPKLRPRGSLPEGVGPRTQINPAAPPEGLQDEPVAASARPVEEATPPARPGALRQPRSQSPLPPKLRLRGSLPDGEGPRVHINPAGPPPEPQESPVAASGGPRPSSTPRPRLAPQRPLSPRPAAGALGPRARPPSRPAAPAVREDPFRLRPAGTEHIDFRGTAAAGAGKALGVAAEEAVGKAGAGLVGKVIGRIVLAPVSELMMGWDTAKEMKRNQETYGAGAWAWLTHNRAMGERAYARLQGTDLGIAHRGGLRTSPDLRGPVASAGIPEDAKLRAAYGTAIKAMNDLGTATSALAKDQAIAGKAARDFTSALIAMAQRAQTIQVTAVTQIDGRQIAKTVTQHQAHDAGGPRGTRRQDTSANLPAVFAPYPGP